MLDQLIQALIASPNEAADDLLLEALAIGNESEKGTALDAIFRRATTMAVTMRMGVSISSSSPRSKREPGQGAVRLSITAGQLTGASPGTTRFRHMIRRVKSYCRVSGGNGSVRSFNNPCAGAPR